MDVVHAERAAHIVRVGDRGDGPDLVVRGVRERQRGDAHEAAVAVVALARKAAARVYRGGHGDPAIEDDAIRRVLPAAQPPLEAMADVARVDAAQLANRVAGRQRHAGVVAPGARRLVVRAVADHSLACEGPAGLELVRHAQGIADRQAVDCVPQPRRREVFENLLEGLQLQRLVDDVKPALRVEVDAARHVAAIGEHVQLAVMRRPLRDDAEPGLVHLVLVVVVDVVRHSVLPVRGLPVQPFVTPGADTIMATLTYCCSLLCQDCS